MGNNTTKYVDEDQQIDNNILNLFVSIRNKLSIINDEKYIQYYNDLKKIKINLYDNLNNVLKSDKETVSSLNKYNMLFKTIVKKRLLFRLCYLYINLHVATLNNLIIAHLKETNSLINNLLKNNSGTKDGTELYKKIVNIIKNIDNDYINTTRYDTESKNIINLFNQKLSEIEVNNQSLKNIADSVTSTRRVHFAGGGLLDDENKNKLNIESLENFLSGLEADYKKYKEAEKISFYYTQKIQVIITLYFDIYQKLLIKSTDNVDTENIAKQFKYINQFFNTESKDFNEELKKSLQKLCASIENANETFKKEFIDKIGNLNM